jgi:hypothetical protein
MPKNTKNTAALSPAVLSMPKYTAVNVHRQMTDVVQPILPMSSKVQCLSRSRLIGRPRLSLQQGKDISLQEDTENKNTLPHRSRRFRNRTRVTTTHCRLPLQPMPLSSKIVASRPYTPALKNGKKNSVRMSWLSQALGTCPFRGSNAIPPDLVTETSVWRSPN